MVMSGVHKMRLATIACLFSFALGALAQDAGEIVSKVEAVKYPSLARQAAITGEVRLRAGAAGVAVISGHPLLVQAASENLKELGGISEPDTDVIYHFAFVNTPVRVTRTTVKRGNAFDRLILRALRMKTERVVEGYDCADPRDLPKNRIELSKDPVEVWIYTSIPCVQTEVSYIAAR